MGFAAAVIAVAGLAGSVWLVARHSAEATQWVSHTHEVLNSLARVRGDGLNIELTTQNFRLTGNLALIKERNATIASREIVLRRIQELTQDNPLQRARWVQLRQVVDDRLAIAKQTEAVRKADGPEAAARYVASTSLKQTREQMYQVLDQMEEEERRLLALRTTNELKANQLFATVGLIVALFLSALLWATYVVIRRQLRATEFNRRALLENEERLATTLRSIGDGVLATDIHGRIISMNPVAEQLTGWQFEQARGRPAEEVFSIIDEHDRQPAQLPIANVLSSGTVQQLIDHAVLIANDGSERPIADSAAPLRDADGKLSGVVMVFRDESAAREARRIISKQNELLEQRVQERTLQLRESQGHLLSVIRHVPAMIAFVDNSQRYVYVNEQYRDRFANGRTDIRGCSVREILGEDRYQIAAPIIEKVLRGESQSYDWQPFPDTWQAINYVPKYNEHQMVTGYYVLGTDITERKLAEEKIGSLNVDLGQHVRDLEHVSRALRTLSACNRSMLHADNEETLLDSMCEAIVAAGGYRIASVWYGANDASPLLQPMAQCGHPGGMPAMVRIRDNGGGNTQGRTAVALAISLGQQRMVRNIHQDPAYRDWPVELTVFGDCVASPLRVNGRVIGALAIYSGSADGFSDDEVRLLSEAADDLAFGIAGLRSRAEQEKIQQVVHRMTFYDAITGLANETQFTQLINDQIASCEAACADATQQDMPQFAVLQANVERLREINDALGFQHGDELLRLFASRLREATGEQGSVSRLRGDEFAILLPNGGVPEALLFATELEAALAAPFPIAGLSLEVAAKVGIAVFPAHGSTAQDLFRHVDIAVNLARRQSQRHAVFDPSHSRGQASRLNMVGELRRAIEGGDLRLYLQPKVNMGDGQVCGVEGLVRWQHAERGLIPPVEFIALAEQTALIKPLTEWVIGTALELNAGWKNRNCVMPIAINLSAPNLRDDSMLEKIRNMRKRLRSPPDLLEMELTESMLMDGTEHTVDVLRQLRAENITLYIDDFGTGYSSLSYLQRLPVDWIKIDKSFVMRMLESKDSAAIVRSTIDLAHDLGRKVVAEGVESQAHWSRLSAFGCDVGQGYFIAAPMPPAEFPAWMDAFKPMTPANAAVSLHTD